jgi:hypothetical protein
MLRNQSNFFNQLGALILIFLSSPWIVAHGQDTAVLVTPVHIVSLESSSQSSNNIAPPGFIDKPESTENAAIQSTAAATVQGGLYQPIGEIVRPANDLYSTRSVGEKNGYVYLLTRDNYLYTYNVSDLLTRTSFATYNSPISTLQLPNGTGLLRSGDYLYVYGYSGLTVVSIQNAASPTVIRSRNDLVINNLVRYDNYLIAPGEGGLAVYSVSTPSSPSLLSTYRPANKWFYAAAVYSNILYTSECEIISGICSNDNLRVLDFSNPYSLSSIRSISAYSTLHLRVIWTRLQIPFFKL